MTVVGNQGTATCSDPINGNYTTDVNTTNFSGILGNVYVAICSKHNIQALPSGSVITISGCCQDADRHMAATAVEFSGITATDQTALGVDGTPYTASAASASTSTTNSANELLFGVIAYNGTQTLTLGTNGTTNTCSNTSSPTYQALATAASSTFEDHPVYCLVSATGAYQVAATLSSSTKWAAVLATYK